MPAVLPAVLGGAPAFPDGLALVRPTLPDTGPLAARLQAVMDSGVLTNGPTVRQLEDTAAAYLGVRHVVAVASCTSGLMLALQAVGADGPVVLPSFTFSATAHAAHWAGGTPAFADVDAATLTLDPAAAAERAGGAAALVATHLYGTPCDVDALGRVAGDAGLPLVYDAAHALGARHDGTPVGGFGTAEVFSLSPTKVVVGGEGGLVATGDDAVAEACRLGRDYGNPGDYDCRFPGLNARMSELHAAVALASLAGLDERVTHRNRLAARFRAAVADLPGVALPQVRPGDRSTFKDLTVLVSAEALGLTVTQLASALRAEGIDTRRYYHPPVHRQKAYAHLDAGPLPVTDRAAEQVVTFPLWSHMTAGTIDQVAGTVWNVAAHAEQIAEALA